MKNTLTLLLLSIVTQCHVLYGQACEGCDNKLLPVLWMQRSGEYTALCHQAYNIAKWRVDSFKKDKKDKRPLAIVTDIDETILDNSYYEAQRIVSCTQFNSSSWKEWTDLASATPIPGAVEFLRYANKKGVKIFYVSNRNTSEVKRTLENLQRFNFPDAVEDHLIFQSNDPSKETRRQHISKTYNITMLLGDNLNDFAQVFESKTNAEKRSEVNQLRNAWGDKFIILPNATYGEWENALLQYKRPDGQQRQEVLRNQLLGIDSVILKVKGPR